MKKIVIIVVMLLTTTLKAQILTFEKLQNELTNYLINNGEIHKGELESYQNGKFKIRISGFHNSLDEGDLKNGVYRFFLTRTMGRGYFLIVENNSYAILDITTRDRLDKSIIDVINYCEKHNYCVDITKMYVERMLEVYFNYNKTPNYRRDLNCEEGRDSITDTKELP